MLEKRLIIVGGKGGVGRTTVSAALATLLARHGRRVLLAHVRTKQRMTRLLDCPVVDEVIRPVEPNLWVVNMNPEAALREQGLKVLRFKAVYKAVMENRLVKYFLRAIPALDEYSMLGKTWFHTTEVANGRRRFDTIVFDGPATGHLVTMLRIPRVILDVVPEGPLTADARQVWELLTNPLHTVLWIVSLAEEMAVSESIELFETARDDLSLTTERLVVNAMYPQLFGGEPALTGLLGRINGALLSPPAQTATPAQVEMLAPYLQSTTTIYQRHRNNRRYLDMLSQRLPLPIVALPHLFTSELDRGAIDRLSAVLERGVEPAAFS